MTYTSTAYSNAPHRVAGRTDALIQDLRNGAFAESLPDRDLALAVLDIAAILPADGVNHAVLDEAARRLSPDIATDPRGLMRIPAIARIADWINTTPPLGAFALGFCVGGLAVIVSVYAFVTQFIQ